MVVHQIVDERPRALLAEAAGHGRPERKLHDRGRRAQGPVAPQRVESGAGLLVDGVGGHRARLRLASGELATKVEVPQVIGLLNGLQKVANRIFTGLVLGGLLVASGLLLQYQRRLGTIGFVIAAIIGGWYYNERQDEKASADFGKALQIFDTPVRPAGMPAQPDSPSFASARR